MAGKTKTSWTFPSRVIIPAAIVLAEATWVSLLVNAVVNTSKGPHVDLPFLGLAVPAVVAAAVGAWSGRLGWRWWWRWAVLVPLAVAGAAATAGLISELTRGGSFWQVATQPWSASGHRYAVIAGAAWFVAGLAWCRGVWLGAAPPSFRQTAWSVALGGAAFVGVFAGRTDAHAPAFRAATGPAWWLLFVGFPFATAALALVRQHDLEEQVLWRARSPLGAVWLTVLAAPMLAVALVAVVVAVTVGPAAPVVGRGVARGGGVVGRAVAAGARALWDLLPSGGAGRPAEPLPPPSGPGPVARPPLQPSHGTLHVPPLVWQLLVAVFVVALVALAVRYLRPIGRLKTRPPDNTEDDERDSVFSWRHLAAQLLASLRHLRLRRRRSPRPSIPSMPAPVDSVDAESVRHAYRRMLTAARASGHPRAATETTRELEARLSRGPAAAAAGSLAGLTVLYDTVRYQEVDAGEALRRNAALQADTVSAELSRVEPQT
jgi:hypothetical protein